MAGAFVQAFSVGSGALVTTVTVTVSGATANNLLVSIIYVRLGGDVFTTPSGWTLLETHSTGNQGAAAYYRVASGDSSDDFIPVWTDSGRVFAVVYEVSGLGSTSPLEDSSEDTTTMTTPGQSVGTGTSTPVTANGMAISGLGVDLRSSWSAGTPFSEVTIDNSFTDVILQSDGGNQPLVGMASKVYTSTAGQSATWSTNLGSANDDEAYGFMSVFKEPAVGGGRIMSSLVAAGGLVSAGGLAGIGGGLAA